MNFLSKLVNIVLLTLMVCLLYVSFPKIDGFVDNVIAKLSNTTSLLQEKIKNIRNFDLENINGIGSLVIDKDIIKDTGYTGENYQIDAAFYPYYDMLDTNYQEIYKQILDNALNLKESFTPISDLYKDDVSQVVESVLYDHPELFWIENEYSFKYDMSGKVVKIILTFSQLALENFDNYKELFEDCANEIIEVASTYTTDYKKEKYVHDTLVDMLEYDLNSSYNQSAYSAIVNHSSVCAGYSRAFQYILTKLGIPCYYVTGYSSGDHAWNIVYIDGKYYNVDLTWDNTGYNRYAYFNKNDSDFSKTHIRSGLSNSLPSCLGDSYQLTGNFDNSKIVDKFVFDNYQVENDSDISFSDIKDFIYQFFFN